MNIRKIALTGGIAAVLASLSAPSWALFGDDEARIAILDLRAKMEEAQNTQKTVQNAQMQLAGMIEQLREQNAELTGRIELLVNELSMQQRSVRDLFGNLDGRVAALEPRSEKVDGKEVTVAVEEKRRYDAALLLFSEGKYERSADLFDLLATDYPQSPYRANALYWAGNARFAAGLNAECIASVNRFVADYADSERVAEALLTKGTAEVNLKRFTAARSTFNSIIKDYEGSETAKLAAERLKRIKKSGGK